MQRDRYLASLERFLEEAEVTQTESRNWLISRKNRVPGLELKDLQWGDLDWIVFFDRLRKQNSQVAEVGHLHKFIVDYDKMVDILATSFGEDAETILWRMNEKKMLPDYITSSILVQVCCRSGKPSQAFETLRTRAFDRKVNNAIVMAYINARELEFAEQFIRETESKGTKIAEKTYMALLRSFSQIGDVDGTDRIMTSLMQFSGFRLNLEAWTLIIEAYVRAQNYDSARTCLKQMMILGLKPHDRCIACVISTYEKENLLDKALKLVSELEKKGFEPGDHTHTVVFSCLMKLERFNEAEQVLNKL